MNMSNSIKIWTIIRPYYIYRLRIFSDKIDVYAISQHNFVSVDRTRESDEYQTTHYINRNIWVQMLNQAFESKEEALSYLDSVLVDYCEVRAPSDEIKALFELEGSVTFYGHARKILVSEYLKGVSLTTLGVYKGVSREALSNIANTIKEQAAENKILIEDDVRRYLVEEMRARNWLSDHEYNHYSDYGAY
jgi:hypothetical protein